ncbi:hypothetical protein [Flavobacterium sp.]|uniref:hypothetical protein n=1 Tax=Flavobacterium sp. TaxID=239 RepID=UPI003751B63C
MQKKIIFSVLFGLSFWFFYRGIPLDFFHEYSTTVVLIGGIITTFLFALALFNLVPVYTANKTIDKSHDNLGCVLIVFVVLFFFGFSIYLIYDEIERTSNEIEKNGIYTTGIIVDGSSYATRKADFSNVTIKFTTKDGKEQTTKQDISASEFSRFSQYQEIPIVYSSRYPSILEILRTDASIAKYSKTKIRELTLKDFIAILDMETPNEINLFLNGVNQKWEYDNGGGMNTTIYENKFKNIALKITNKKELIYILNGVNQQFFDREIKELGFTKTEISGGKGILYSNENYILNVRIEKIDTNDENDILGFKQVSIIDLLKVK